MLSYKDVGSENEICATLIGVLDDIAAIEQKTRRGRTGKMGYS